MEKDHLAGLNQLHWETWKRKQFFFIILKTKSCTKTTIEPEINITIINYPHPAIPWIPLRREGRPAPSLICKLSLTTTISSWWSTTALSSPRSYHSSLGQYGRCLHFSLAMSFSLTYVNLVLWSTFLLFWGSVWDLGSVSFVFRDFDFIFGVHHLQRWNLVHSVTAGGSVKFLPTV